MQIQNLHELVSCHWRSSMFGLMAFVSAAMLGNLASGGVIVSSTAGSGSHLNILDWQQGSGNQHVGTVNDTPPVSPARTVSIMTGMSSNSSNNEITPNSGNTLGSLVLDPGNFAGFSMLSINLDITDNSQGSFELQVTVETMDQNGAPLTYSVDETGAGSQRFQIESTNGEIITKVTLSPLGDSLLEKISQVRIDKLTNSLSVGGGGGGAVTHSPEPSSLALWGMGMALAYWGTRRHRFRRAA